MSGYPGASLLFHSKTNPKVGSPQDTFLYSVHQSVPCCKRYGHCRKGRQRCGYASTLQWQCLQAGKVDSTGKREVVRLSMLHALQLGQSGHCNAHYKGRGCLYDVHYKRRERKAYYRERRNDNVSASGKGGLLVNTVATVQREGLCSENDVCRQ